MFLKIKKVHHRRHCQLGESTVDTFQGKESVGLSQILVHKITKTGALLLEEYEFLTHFQTFRVHGFLVYDLATGWV